MDLILHGYWRSGTSYRTRIALNLKGLAYRTRPLNLLEGEQSEPSFKALNPQGLVPALETPDGVLIQSVAILEWLEERFPEPPLLPAGAWERAQVRAMSSLIACDIHPLNNLRVLRTLRHDLGATQDRLDAWAQGWITKGFTALEMLVQQHGRDFCFGDRPTLADCALIPQVYSAERFNADLTPFPAIVAITARARSLPAFAQSHPDRQPDAA